MKSFLFLAALLLLAPAVALAQDETPEVEVFGGYSYLRGDRDILAIESDRANLSGWEGSLTYNVNRWLGLEADFGGHYASGDVTHVVPPSPALPGSPGFSYNVDADARQHTFLFGPRVSARTGRVTPFAHALVGAAHISRDIAITLTPQPPFGPDPVAFDVAETSLAFAVGGGVDVTISDHVAIRAVQVDYLRTRFEEGRVNAFGGFGGLGSQNNARVSVGVVFRFGAR